MVEKYFAPFDTELFRTSHSHNQPKHSQFVRSFENNYLLILLANPMFKNPPTSKSTSNLRTYDPSIIILLKQKQETNAFCIKKKKCFT